MELQIIHSPKFYKGILLFKHFDTIHVNLFVIDKTP